MRRWILRTTVAVSLIAFAFTLVGVFVAGCSRRPVTANITLPSGTKITITSITPIHFLKGGETLVLNCETDTSINDKANLRKEVDEIWTIIFRKQVERVKVNTGVIRISQRKGSGLTRNEGYEFTFEKRADGQWNCREENSG